MLLSSCCCSGIYLEFTGWVKCPLILWQHTENIFSSAAGAGEAIHNQAQAVQGRQPCGFKGEGIFLYAQVKADLFPPEHFWGTNFGLTLNLAPNKNGA